MKMLLKIGMACIAPLLLAGCLLTPGKFESTMSIDADRRFSFTYTGEVIAIDPSDKTSDGVTTSSDSESESDEQRDERQRKSAERESKNREIAAALSKEAGYRSVEYKGDGVFEIDYAIAGTLSHSFVFPFNVDAQIMVPFIAVEVRKDGLVRMKAPAFGKSNGQGMGGLPGTPDPGDKAEGAFTLSTNAAIISQNNEAGAKSQDGRKVIRWDVGKLKSDAPTVVLRMED